MALNYKVSNLKSTNLETFFDNFVREKSSMGKRHSFNLFQDNQVLTKMSENGISCAGSLSTLMSHFGIRSAKVTLENFDQNDIIYETADVVQNFDPSGAEIISMENYSSEIVKNEFQSGQNQVSLIFEFSNLNKNIDAKFI